MKKFFMLMCLWVILISSLIAQGNAKIRGIVTNEEGEPLVGVNVYIKNTYWGAATDADGYYVINGIQPGTYTLVAQYIGYKTYVKDGLVLSAGQDLELNIKLEQTELLGEEVVVVGYSEEKRKNLTGSISSVSADAVEKIATPDVLTALQGMASGVMIENYSGEPGVTSNIKIRGIGTINNNAPLYIIDGAPGDITDVDPEDIENITVLKDASAAAIYGTRAANGVIIIQTKRGGDKPLSVSYDGYRGFQTLAKKLDLTNAAEYIKVTRMAYENAGLAVPQYVIDFENNPSVFPDVDWQDAYFRDAPIEKHHLSISGATNNSNYNISGTYSDIKGIAVATGSKRMSLRINSDYTRDKLVFGESFSISHVETEWTDNSGTEAGYQVVGMLPIIPVYDENNEGGFGGPKPGMPDPTNPVGYNRLTTSTSNTDNVRLLTYMEYSFYDWLKYKAQVGFSRDYGYTFFHQPTFYMGYASFNEKAVLSETRSRNTYWIFEQTLSAQKDFGQHSLSGILGFSREKTKWRNTGASVRNFPNNDIKVLGAGTEDADVWGSEYVSKLESIFGRISYSYADRYLAQFNIRRDGSSRFDENNRYGVFPSFSAGWKLHNESFFSALPYHEYINEFKIHGSYGVLGNQEIGDYSYIPGISVGGSGLGYVLGDPQQVWVGAAITEFPSVGIKWETTKITDLGFNLAFLNDRITFGASYYIKKTSDMLVNVPIPTSTGVSTGPVVNAGEMENKGVELNLGYHDVEGEFKYSFEGNLTTIKNKILKLGYSDEVIWGGALQWDQFLTTKSMVGGEIGAFWLYKTAGIFQSEDEINSYVNDKGELLQPNAKPGDIKFVDVNGDGVINDDDRVYMGSAIPDFEYGFNFSATYKNFDFSMVVHGVYGKKMINGTRWYAESMIRPLNYTKATLNAWTPENPNTDIPRAVYGDPNGNGRPSDRWLEDASYLRINNIQIGYTVPQSFFKFPGNATVRFYINATNLLTITDYSGYDPAVTGYGLFSRGVDRGLYPPAKSYQFGVQYKF